MVTPRSIEVRQPRHNDVIGKAFVIAGIHPPGPDLNLNRVTSFPAQIFRIPLIS